MRKIIVNYLFLPNALALLLFVSCKKKDDLNIPLIDIGGDTWVKTNTDNWL